VVGREPAQLACRAGTDPGCPDVARYPCWSALGETALYVLDLEAAGEMTENAECRIDSPRSPTEDS